MPYQIPPKNMHPRSHYLELAGRMLEMPSAKPDEIIIAMQYHWDLDFSYFMDIIDSFEKTLYKAQKKASKVLLEKCMQPCESCEKEFEIESMSSDDGGNWFCEPCWEVIASALKKEYNELVAKGEIEPNT